MDQAAIGAGHRIPSMRELLLYRWKYIVVIAAAIAIVYGRAAQYDFVTYDDVELVVQNGSYLSDPSNVFHSFATHAFTTHRAESGYYRPLLLVSYIIDYQLWQLNPFGYHLTNILLHCLSTILLFALLEILVRNSMAALGGSLLFALHPLQIESVAWVAGRNDVLLGLFIIIMMLAYIRSIGGDTINRRAYAFAVFGFVLALFTKESAAFYLLLLPIADLTVREKSLRSLFTPGYLLRMFPFVIALGAYLLIRLMIFGEMIGAEKLYGSAPLHDRILLVPSIASEHLKLLAVPIGYSVVHPMDQLLWIRQPWTIVSWMLPALLIFILWRSSARAPVVSFGLAWLAAGLLPVLGLFPLAVAILEHRLYLPLAGVALAAAAFISRTLPTSRRPQVIFTFSLVIVALLGFISFNRLPVWQNSETMWRDAIEKAPSVSRSYFNLAGYFFERQQYDQTIDLMKKYVALRPDEFIGYSKLRQSLYLAGRYDEAAQVNRALISRTPYNPNRYLEAAAMFEQLNKFDSAAAVYVQGLQADSNLFDLHFHLGLVLERQGQLADAERHLKRAVEINPGYAPAVFGLAGFYARESREPEATRYFELATTLGTPPDDVLTSMKELYSKTGKSERGRALSQRFGIQFP